MKEPPFPSHNRKLPSIKLLCSYNGSFLPRPPNGKLRYVGGETRILSLDRAAGISRIRSKIFDFCPNHSFLHLVYRLLETAGEPPLVPITTNDDVRRMIEEHDKLVCRGMNVRLRVFVLREDDRKNAFGEEMGSTHLDGICSSGVFIGVDASQPKIRDTYVAEVRNLIDFYSPMAIGMPISTTHVSEIQNSGDFIAPRSSQLDSSCICIGQVRNHDNSLSPPPPALSPEMIATHSTGVHNLVYTCGGNLHVPKSPMTGGAAVQSFSSLHPLLESSSRFCEGLVHGDGFLLASGKQLDKNGELSNQVCMFRQSLIKSECVHISELNQENVKSWNVCRNFTRTPPSPVSCINRLDRDIAPSDFVVEDDWLSGIQDHNTRNCRRWVGETRNYQITSYDNPSYQISSYDISSCDVASHRVSQLDWKQRTGRCNVVLRPKSSILKPGQARLPHVQSGKARRVANEHNKEATEMIINSSRGTQHLISHENGRGILRERSVQPRNRKSTFDHFHGNVGLLRMKVGGKGHDHHLGYCRGQHGFLEGKILSHKKGYEIQSQTLCMKPFSDAHHSPVVDDFGSSHHVRKSGEQSFIDEDVVNSCSSIEIPEKDVDVTGCSVDIGLRFDSESLYSIRSPPYNQTIQVDHTCKTLEASSKESCSNQIPCDKYPLDLSLHKTPLLSSTEVAPSTLRLSFDHAENLVSNVSIDNDVSPRGELGLQFIQMDLKDSMALNSSVPQIENLTEVSMHKIHGDSSTVSSDTSIKEAIELGSLKSSGPSPSHLDPKPFGIMKDLTHGENQQMESTNLNMEVKANEKQSGSHSEVVGEASGILPTIYTKLANQKLQTIKNSDLEEIRELGSGTYGTVLYGKWKGSDVAIKRIKPSCFDGGGGELGEDRLIGDFWKEAHLLAELHHPNVVAIYGVVTDGPLKNLATVTEYMVNGSLKQVLQKKDRTIDRRKRLILAMDAAFGMEYLHEKNVVHFDLKSHNFLVNMRDPHRPICKIGDLGLSKVKQKTLVSGGVRGTLPWMAPELLTVGKSNMVTEKVDVYSFGIVMWELLTGEEPYAGMRSEEIIAGILRGDLRPEIPNWCDPLWRSLMERCWSSNPNLRPSFSEIAKELRAMSAAMNIK
ncbi:hypothetical protein AAC387_Pa02g0688 [Persea americana]